MNFAIWVAIAVCCFLLPATALTSGGKTSPSDKKLTGYARNVGLPLPDSLVTPVVARIRRRQRGMIIGGVAGLIIATVAYIVFATNDDTWAGTMVVLLTAMGTGFGGAWAIASHRPSSETQRPVVARMREVKLTDYLTQGERFGFWATPIVTILGAVAGAVILWQLPQTSATPRILFGAIGALLALATWCAAFVSLRQVLAAPARSETELELAWDDAERADGLRQVTNLSVALVSLSLLFWLIFIADSLLSDGFYRDNLTLSYLVTAVALVVFLALIAIVASGPIAAWVSGSRKGYEQRQLWPSGVSA